MPQICRYRIDIDELRRISDTCKGLLAARRLNPFRRPAPQSLSTPGASIFTLPGASHLRAYLPACRSNNTISSTKSSPFPGSSFSPCKRIDILRPSRPTTRRLPADDRRTYDCILRNDRHHCSWYRCIRCCRSPSTATARHKDTHFVRTIRRCKFCRLGKYSPSRRNSCYRF